MPCKKETTTRERKKKSKSNKKSIYSQKHIRLQQQIKDKSNKN